MNFPLRQKISFQCPECKNNFEEVIEIDEIEDSSVSEKNMGKEYIHTFTSDISCKACNVNLFYELNISEYPEGALNHITVFKIGSKT